MQYIDNEYLKMAEHLLLAAAAGGIIGLERSYHGRPAGFRTHTLVCTASALLMLVTVYQWMWFIPQDQQRITLDPTRMAQGIMTGIGFYIPAGFAVVLTLGTLSVFRWIELKMPMNYYAQFIIRFSVSQAMEEPALRKLVADHGFSVANLSYRLDRGADFYEYRMIIRTIEMENQSRLSAMLSQLDSVLEFRIAPTGD